jgi:hypothetical protein
VIKEYNRQLLLDKKFSLPEGYKTVKEPRVTFVYELLAKLGISEAQKTAYECLNDILNDMLGFKLIEPTTVQESVLICRPNMLGYVKSKVSDVIKHGVKSDAKDKELQL